MIHSKLRAYRLNNGEWEPVSRWHLIKMADTEYRKYKDQYFPLYLSKSENSPKLTFNTKQKTFRFYPNQGFSEHHSSHSLTIAHQLAQEVLSEIRVLNFKLKDKRTKPYKDVEFQIEVDNVFLEQRMEISGNAYIADLLISFSKPHDLSLQWNRFMVLEIFVTNDVRGNKILDFEKKKYHSLKLE